MACFTNLSGDYYTPIYILYTDGFYVDSCTPFCYKVKLYSYFPNPFIWYSLWIGSGKDNTVLLLLPWHHFVNTRRGICITA